jgi:ribosomal protein S18 acetylase RimI-like enzyme
MAIKVRSAVPEDAQTIAEFALSLFAQHRDYDQERFADLGNIEGAKWFYGGCIGAKDAAVLIVENEGRPAGYAYLQYEAVSYADLLESVAWLHDIYLDDSARGIGAGKILIDAAVAAGKELGADKMVLHVAAKNAIGQGFFERAGLRTTMFEMMLKLTE